MKKRFLLFSGLFLFLFAGLVSGVVSEDLSFQGQLTNSDNTIVSSGDYNFTFNLYADGVLVVSENATLSVDGFGIYDYTLSDVNQSFDGVYTLGIGVNGGSEMTPRVNLSSVGSSFRSKFADNVSCSNIDGSVSNLCTLVDTFWLVNSSYLYNGSDSLFFNESKLNQTISSLDTDTTYVNGSGLNLSGNTFSILNSYFTNWNTAYSWGDHSLVGYLTSESDPLFVSWGFDWNNLTSVPSGFSDGVDNDSQLNESQVDSFVSNNGYLTGYTESDPLWTANQSSYSTTSDILGWAYYNSSDFVISDYYLVSNPYSFYNSSTLQNLSQLNDDLGHVEDNQSWNESLADGLYVNIAGDTMTGNLFLENITVNNGIFQDNHYIIAEEGNSVFGSNDLMTLYMNNSVSGDYYRAFSVQPGAPYFANTLAGSLMLLKRNYTLLDNVSQFNNVTVWQDVYDGYNPFNYTISANSEDGFADLIVGDVKIYDDLFLTDEQGEWHSMQRVNTRIDNLVSDVLLGTMSISLNDTAVVIDNTDVGFDSDIKVNLDGVVYSLGDTDSVVLSSGTNTSPAINYLTVYNDSGTVDFVSSATYPGDSDISHSDVGRVIVGEQGNFYLSWFDITQDYKVIYGIHEAAGNQYERYVSGLAVTDNSSSLSFGSGEYFNGLTEFESTNSIDLISDGFFWVRNNGSFVQCNDLSSSCLDEYDDGTSLPTNYYLNVVVGLVPDSLNTSRLVVIPQNTPDSTYINVADALADEDSAISYSSNNPLIDQADLILARIIIDEDGVLQQVFGNKYFKNLVGVPIAGASGGGTNDHSLLTNLGWSVNGHLVDSNQFVVSSDVLVINETYLSGVLDTDNASWNQSFANTLYAPISVDGDITSVTTSGDYLNGGTLDGDANLLFNETLLNVTIDLRDSDTLYTSGTGLTLSGTVFSHNDSSSQSSIDSSGRTYIQDVVLDTFGHVTGLTTSTEVFVDTNETVRMDVIYDEVVTNSSNWNTAYSWGDHSVAGYYLSSNPSGFYNSSDFVISDYVPYSGAVGNVDLGVYNLSAGFLFGDGSFLTNLPSGDNASWNQSFADTLYYSVSNPDGFISGSYYTHLSNFSDDIGVSSDWDEIGDIPADSVGDVQLSFDTGQDLTTTSNVTFAKGTFTNINLTGVVDGSWSCYAYNDEGGCMFAGNATCNIFFSPNGLTRNEVCD